MNKLQIMILFIGAISITSLIGHFLIAKYGEECQQCKMYNPEIEHTIDGVWHLDGYYCVWTEGRNAVDINETDKHENCHALIHEDYEHFCGG